MATKQIVGSIAAGENLGDTRTGMIGIAGVDARDQEQQQAPCD